MQGLCMGDTLNLSKQIPLSRIHFLAAREEQICFKTLTITGMINPEREIKASSC